MQMFVKKKKEKKMSYILGRREEDSEPLITLDITLKRTCRVHLAPLLTPCH